MSHESTDKTKTHGALFSAVAENRLTLELLNDFLATDPELLNKTLSAEEVQRYSKGLSYWAFSSYSPLTLALHKGYADIVSLLISRGAMLSVDDIHIVSHKELPQRKEFISLLTKASNLRATEFVNKINTELLKTFEHERCDLPLYKCLLAVGAKIDKGAQEKLLKKEPPLSSKKILFLLKHILHEDLKIEALKIIIKNWKDAFFNQDVGQARERMANANEHKYLLAIFGLKNVPIDAYVGEDAILLYVALTKNDGNAEELISKGCSLSYKSYKKKSMVFMDREMRHEIQDVVHHFINKHKNKPALVVCFLNDYIPKTAAKLSAGEEQGQLNLGIWKPKVGFKRKDKLRAAQRFLNYVKACQKIGAGAKWELTQKEFDALNNSDLGHIYAFFKKYHPELIEGIKISTNLIEKNKVSQEEKEAGSVSLVPLSPDTTAEAQPNVSTSSSSSSSVTPNPF